MKDQYGREIDYLRISVTDRCNLHCRFCMPNEPVPLEKPENLLSVDEILQVVEAVIPLGIHKFRLTGGEPLMRKEIATLIKEMKKMKGLHQIALTTNGILFAEQAEKLKVSGLDRVNISLCSTDEKEYQYITGINGLCKVLNAVDAAIDAGIYTKINCVPLPKMNEDHLMEVAALAKEKPVDIRFIEMMPIGQGMNYAMISEDEMMKRLTDSFGIPIPAVNVQGSGPAVYYHFPGFVGNIGIISARSHAFCSQCNRIRLTANGWVKRCLNYEAALNLRDLLRSGITKEELSIRLSKEIFQKPRKHNFSKGYADNGKDGNQKDHLYMAQIGG